MTMGLGLKKSWRVREFFAGVERCISVRVLAWKINYYFFIFSSETQEKKKKKKKKKKNKIIFNERFGDFRTKGKGLKN